MKGFRLISVSIIIIASFLVFFNSCGKDVDQVKIGVIMPLTGNAAVYGVPSLNAMKLAVEEFLIENETDKVQIKLVSEDSQANPAMGVSAIQKLISADRIQAVLGPLASGVSLACAPVAEKNKVIMLTPSSSTPALTNAGEYIFRTELSELQGGFAQADIGFEKLGYKNIACVYINNDYGASLFDVFKKRFEEIGGTLVYAEGFTQGTTDFKTILSKITSLELDAIFIISHDEILNFVRQMAELNLSVPVYTTPVFEDQRNLEKLGDLAEGIIYTYYGEFDPSSKKEIIKNFIDNYRSKYNESPTYYAALAYDATWVLLKALKKNNYKFENLKDVLAKTKDFIGVTGKMSFDQNGDILKPVSLKKVKAKKFVFF